MAKRQSPVLFWAAVGVGVPLAYFSSLAAEGGAPIAEGCSGSGSSAAPQAVRSLLGPTDQLSVGRDGFFAFVAYGSGVDAAGVLDAIEVEVRDAADAVVPGELTPLAETPDVGATKKFSVSWKANAPLAAGETLHVLARLPDSNPAVENRATLGVVEATTELTWPAFQLRDWSALTRDTGETRLCQVSPLGGCGPYPFGADTEELQQVTLASEGLPASPVIAAWEYTAVEVHSKGTLAQPLVPSIVLTSADKPNYLELTPMFRDVVDEYCLLVTLRDLRTGQTISQQVCSSPQRPLPRLNHDRARDCGAVEPEFLSRWCDGRDASFDPSCPPAPGASGTGGSGNVGSAGGSGPTPIGGSSSAPEPPASAGSTNTAPPAAGSGSDAQNSAGYTGYDDAAWEDDTTMTEGCGCRLAPSGGHRDAWLSVAAMAALGFAWARRRRLGR